ncbi:hypothetical protein DNTS_032246 [Danionella cerebrum]|uniref:Uncharacterized protein n=1 Tax=Danionella cerebrum TaxID=2873325 RepID=A0A553NAH9_9TELE|nr:hypothetical protein DNTS_032246 [Danionella translucida]
MMMTICTQQYLNPTHKFSHTATANGSSVSQNRFITSAYLFKHTWEAGVCLGVIGLTRSCWSCNLNSKNSGGLRKGVVVIGVYKDGDRVKNTQ